MTILDQPIAKHRVEALSDGVYAIAITLLVLELKLPSSAEALGAPALRQALVELVPKLLAWLLSFGVMALFWLAQQKHQRYSVAIDRTGVFIELAQLALISLLPFSSALMGEHGDQVIAAAVYSAHLLGLSLLSLARVGWLAHQPALQAAAFTPAVRHVLLLRAAAVCVCTALALALAFVVPGWNMLALLLLLALRALAVPASSG